MGILTRDKTIGDWCADPRVHELEIRLAKVDADLAKIPTELEPAERDLAAAEAAIGEQEAMRLVGVGEPADHAAATAAVEGARERVAKIHARELILRREREAIEPAAVIVADEAKAEARDELHRAYRDAISEMDRALQAASDANARVYEIRAAALEAFGAMPERSSRGVNHPSYGGLPLMAWDRLAQKGQAIHTTEIGAQNVSRLEDWRREAIAGGWLDR